MKIFGWTEDNALDFTKSNDGSISFYSHPDLWNFSSGDQIHYKTRLGISVFEIISIEPAYLRDHDPKLKQVVAKKLDG